MLYRLLLLLLLSSFLLGQGNAMAGTTLKVNTSIKPPFSTADESGFFDLLIKELFKRAKIDTELVRLPAERALFSANEGVSDIELPRIAGMEKKYPNLVMIPEKVIDYKFVAFTRTSVPIKTWNDLEKMRVGYILGWKIFEANIPEDLTLSKLKNPSQLFAMLDGRRLDVVLYESYAGWNIIQNQKISAQECTPPLAVRPMYMYLNKDNKALVSILDQHLKAMKADGTYQKIVEKTLGAK